MFFRAETILKFVILVQFQLLECFAHPRCHEIGTIMMISVCGSKKTPTSFFYIPHDLMYWVCD